MLELLSIHWSVTEGSSKSERINDLKMEVRPAAAEGSFVEDMQTVGVTEDTEVGGGVGRRAAVAPLKEQLKREEEISDSNSVLSALCTEPVDCMRLLSVQVT